LAPNHDHLIVDDICNGANHMLELVALQP
jgi:hypothetical protein